MAILAVLKDKKADASTLNGLIENDSVLEIDLLLSSHTRRDQLEAFVKFLNILFICVTYFDMRDYPLLETVAFHQNKAFHFVNAVKTSAKKFTIL